MNEAFALPLTQTERKENVTKHSSTPDTFRGSYKTYIHDTNTYKRKTDNVISDLNFY